MCRYVIGSLRFGGHNLCCSWQNAVFIIKNELCDEKLGGWSPAKLLIHINPFLQISSDYIKVFIESTLT